MKKILYCTLFILLIFSVVGCELDLPNNPWFPGTPTPAPGATYTRFLGGAGLVTWGHGIAANTSGIYITGEIRGAGSFDGITVNNSAFLAKYDTSGNKLKTIVYNGVPGGTTMAYAVTADTSGVYITGGSYGSSSPYEAFIAKYDNSGNKLWEKKPITKWEYETNRWHTAKNGRGIATDSTGVYVTGETNAWPNGKELYNAFVTKYDANGTTMLWSKSLGSNNESTSAEAIAVDPSGLYVYVTGSTRDVLEVKQGARDVFVAKYNASTGDRLWVKQLGATGDTDSFCVGYGISATSSGIYVICRSSSATIFDGVPYTDNGSRPFMVIFDPSGNRQTKILGDEANFLTFEDITSDSTGVYAVGWGSFSGSSWQAFVAKYDFSGNEVGIKTLNSSPSATFGNAISKTASGIYITGYTYGDFDGQTRSGNEDAFITNKLNF